ncbi:MAG: undecaprenyldiphospho-muramoylpentapeptide beta-N-acetylglucosaminyltransferase [Candidatus Aceula meridiana]|nr:undecaprenyldiphospho-muramoylpentapeptide beta-N-acetylglucosaminyltransferase [Candidatus Aceula meridiana]
MKIVIAAGGSGGHVFPAIYTAKQLKARGHDVVFLTTQGLPERLVLKNDFKAHVLCAKGMSLSSPAFFIKSVLAMIKAIGQASRLIKEISPDVVAGFGGYVAFPAVIVSYFQNRPVILHEQNVVPGRANRWASKFVKNIAASFPQTKKYFSNKKITMTGCPCREPLDENNNEGMYQELGLLASRPTILVLGGSQGSQKINEEFSRAVDLLQGGFDFQLIHLCGEKDYGAVKGRYQDIKQPYCVLPFLDEIDKAYQLADLVICRAGAVTIFELMRFCKKAIVVPYPFAGAHQKENANILVEVGLAKIIEDQDLSASRLKNEIQKMIVQEINKKEVLQRIKPYSFPNASQLLADVIEGAA